MWTPPLRPLTPETSFGFDLIDFALDILGVELDPWQQWAAIHLGELLEDGRPRFRTVLLLVARQNGKSLLGKVLILYWLAVEQVPEVLATSTDRSYAKRAWREVCDIAETNAVLRPITHVRKAIGEEALLVDGATYTFAANNGRAGRSLTVHRYFCDEIRMHESWDTWGSATKAMQAVPGGQVVAMSNQGGEGAVVLDSLRTSALDFIETGQGDPRLGLFEWSAEAGADPTDPAALAMANPDLGNRIQLDSLIGDAIRAQKAGGPELASFRTEVLCERVTHIDAAIDEGAWTRCGTETFTPLVKDRARVALGVDVAMDGSHAALVAAVLRPDGKVHVEVVHAWDDYGAISMVRRELPAIVARVRPGAIGWFPQGPMAGVAAEMRSGWVPRGTTVEEITTDLTAVCMGLAEQVGSGEIVHPNDPMLDRHVTLAQRLRRGDAWVFTRAGSGPIDGAYALAGAVHLARTMPPPKPTLVAL